MSQGLQQYESGMNTQQPRNRCPVARATLLGISLIATASVWAVSGAAIAATQAPTADAQQSSSQPDQPSGSPGPALPAAALAQEERVALVIGNSTYKDAPLGNPSNDARAMAIRLKELGFKVMERENASLEEMRKSVRDFGNQLALGAAGLFYYAGHGIQSGGTNYLIPVDADIQDETELATRAFAASEVLEKMDAAKNRINIVILDACRNNPLTRKVRSASHGLAPMEQGSGMIIAFATKPGSTSIDGEGSHGLYTGELLDALGQPGLSVEEVFKQVRLEVSRKSNGEQIPWENSSLLGEFYFNPGAGQSAALQTRSFNASLNRPATGESGSAAARDLAKVLLPRRLLENYQLTANSPLSAPVALGEFTPDARHFVMVTQDKQLKVLDAATGNVTFSHAGFDAPNSSADGRYVAGVADEHLVNVLDTTADNPAVKTYRAVGDVQTASIAPSGQRLLVISRTGALSVLKLETDTVVGSPIKSEGELQVKFSPSGNRAAVWNSKNDDLLIIDLDSGKRVGRTSAHRKPINLVRFSPDGSLLLTAADDDATYVWRTSDGSKIARMNFGDKSPLPTQAEFIDDGKHVLLDVAEVDKQGLGTHYRLGIWDVTSGKQLAVMMPDALLSDLQFSVDRQQLYVTTTDRTIRVFDMNTKAARTTLSGAELIGFSPDGARLIAREGDGVRLYDARTLTPVARMPGQVSAFIAPKTNGLFATAGNDGSLRLWEFEHGDPVSLLKGHLDNVSRVNFAAGGKRLVSFSRERVAKFWGLPDVQGSDKLRKDPYESTTEYEARVAQWSSPFTALVELGDYNADAETYAVKVGDYSFPVPVMRNDARRFAGQREAVLSGRLKVFDSEQLQLAEEKLERVP
jgi:WD40 repeat protein